MVRESERIHVWITPCTTYESCGTEPNSFSLSRILVIILCILSPFVTLNSE
jgi:hypothetical protein